MRYNFYPGPSKIYPQVAGYFEEALDLGILERNHRSNAFEQLFSETKILLKTKLNIPLNYEIVLVSSATECWEIIAQSFISRESTHLFNGAFGQKWWDYTRNINSEAKSNAFDVNSDPQMEGIDRKTELIALTHNETSNGTAIGENFQKVVRKEFSNCLIAYDATSSMAGYELDWDNGDIWFASVQKCFGLPAGMALMIVSPKAIERAGEINENRHYNSFNFILKNARNNQTHHTPNISNVFFLNRLMQNVENISAIHSNLKERKRHFYDVMCKLENLRPLVHSEECQSDTVFCFEAEKEVIEDLKTKAINQGMIIGNGYGEHKETTIRIANFPAIPNQHYTALLNFLSTF